MATMDMGALVVSDGGGGGDGDGGMDLYYLVK